MSSGLQWESDGRLWPHRDASSFIESGGIRWHVQQMGEGPAIVLLHGTGASCHSWRCVMPALARDFCVIAPDLPGHAFTRAAGATSRTLPAMARVVSELLDTLEVEPALLVGHSAGAAIAAQMLLEQRASTPMVGLNAALTPFDGPGATLFPAMAKLLFLNPLVPRLFAGMARVPGEADRFIYRSTHSRIDSEGLRCYEKLLGNSAHCRGALAMMANWDLDTLFGRLPEQRNPVLLIHSERDNAIPVSSARRAQEQLADATLEVVPSLGHLAHEESPGEVADRIKSFWAAQAEESLSD